MLKQALKYLEDGFYPIPIQNNKAPSKQIKSLKLLYEEPPDEKQIRAWWKAEPKAGIALICKDLLIIDCDFLKPRWNDPRKHDQAFSTITTPYKVLTKHGFHAYYRMPEGGSAELGVSPGRPFKSYAGLELFSGDHLITAPPSVIDGHTYTWVKAPKNISSLSVASNRTLRVINKFEKGKDETVTHAHTPSIRRLLDLYEIPYDEETISSKHSNCPFSSHKDNSPSFRLSDKDEGVYYCTCAPGGTAGNFIQFIASINGWVGYQERYTTKPGVKSQCYEELKRFGIELTEDDKEAVEALEQIEKLNEEFFYMSGGNGNVWREKDGEPHQPFTSKGFLDYMGNQYIGEMPLGKAWMGHPMRRTYTDFVFEPSGGHTADEYNMFRGFHHNPIKGNNHQFLLDHIKHLICDEKEMLYDWFMDWLAHIFQKPWEKPGTACVLYTTAQGGGKGSLVRALEKLLKGYTYSTSRSEFLSATFNFYIANKIIVFADEATWGGYKNIQGHLQYFITEPTIPAEVKYGGHFQISSYHRLMVTTNNMWSVPLGVGDRRFTFLDVNLNKVGEMDHWRKFYAKLDQDDWQENMIYELMSRKIKNNVHQPFMTELKLDAALPSMEPFWQWWMQILHNGYFIGQDGSQVILQDGGESRVYNKDLWISWLQFAAENHHERAEPKTIIMFGRKFKKVALTAPWKTSSGKGTGYFLKPLSQNRKYFMHLHSWQDWPDELPHYYQQPELEVV